METIRNYLETMFSHLPNTPEVIRAKNELWQMMEDKYNELKEEGKSENEAIGTVISEFGNLDELSEALGIQEYVAPESSGNFYSDPNGNREEAPERHFEANAPRRMLSMDEAREFLRDRSQNAFFVALGIFFCIISPTGSIFFSDTKLEWLGNSLLFILVTIGVILIVFSCIQFGHRWDFLTRKKENCTIDFATTRFVSDQKDLHRNAYALQLVIGIALCILSVVPESIISEFNIKHSWLYHYDIGSVLLFLFVAVGVFLIVAASMTNGGYHLLLHLNDSDTVGGNFVPTQNPKEQYITPAAAAIMSVYWQTVTCIYLIWSFLSFDWWITWIIWPIAAIIHPILKSILVK